MSNHPTPKKWGHTRAAGVVAACVAIGLGATACGDEEGSGDIARLTISNIQDPKVTALTVLDDIDVVVNVRPHAPQSGSLRVDDNLVNDTDIWVDDDGELFVGWGSLLDIEPSQQPVLTLNVQELESVENRSDATVTVNGVDDNDFAVRSSGDGAVRASGQATDLEIDVSDSRNVNLQARRPGRRAGQHRRRRPRRARHRSCHRRRHVRRRRRGLRRCRHVRRRHRGRRPAPRRVALHSR